MKPTGKTKVHTQLLFRIRMEMPAWKAKQLMDALQDVLALGIEKHSTRDTLTEFFRDMRAAGLG